MVCPSFESTSQPSPDTAMRSRLSVGSEVRNERIVSGGPEGFGAPNIDLSHPIMTVLGRVYAQPRRSFLLLRLGLLQQLQLADVGESVQLKDETGVGAGGDAPAAILVVIQELHPDSIVVAPFDLVLRRPVVPVRAVGRAAGLIEPPQRRQRVAVVP